jgi:uncharacterized iron-regulated membrane protein
MNKLKNILIQIHNCTGTLLSFMFLIWFLSGFVLIYAGFPHLSREKYFQSLEPMHSSEMTSIQMPSSNFKGRVELEKLNGELVYRVSKSRGNQKVYSAFTLQNISDISEQQAVKIAEKFSGNSILKVEKREQLDQWIPWSYYESSLPFYLCYVDDEQASRVYVSAKNGKVLQETNCSNRWAARLGAIPHWIYFKSLRLKRGLWLKTVYWISLAGVIMCLAGLLAGFIRLRKKRKNESWKAYSPYKKFWYKWHHIVGFMFGIFVFTFILSGMISVSGISKKIVPVHSQKSPRQLWNQQLILGDSLLNLTELFDSEKTIKKVEWKTVMNELCLWVYKDHHSVPQIYTVRNNHLQKRSTYSKNNIEVWLGKIYPNLEYNITLLDEMDAYYHPSKEQKGAFPVWKIELKDKDETRMYVSPIKGELIRSYNKNGKWNRWLYRGLHTFDFPFLLQHEWLRKLILIVLSIAGTFISISGCVLGYKWVRRKVNF